MQYKNILVNALVNLGDVILTTSAIIETISVRSKNNSLYVTIGTALLSKRAKSAL